MNTFRNFCKCGYASTSNDEGRHLEPRNADVEEDTRWESNKKFTREVQTNASGKIYFANTSRKIANYVRVAFPTDGTKEEKKKAIEVASLWIIDEGAWNLPKPNLIISVTGASKRDFTILSNTKRKRFKRGIVQTAFKTGTYNIQTINILLSTNHNYL